MTIVQITNKSVTKNNLEQLIILNANNHTQIKKIININFVY